MGGGVPRRSGKGKTVVRKFLAANRKTRRAAAKKTKTKRKTGPQ